MEIKFPCGSRGRAEFCPNLCQFGKFCKVKEKKQEPRDLTEDEGSVEEVQEKAEVEFYY